MLASLTIAAAAMVAWVLALCAPWGAWRIREVLEPACPQARPDAARIAVLVPARNEERHIGRCLESILAQGRDLQVVVVDDRSTDRTAYTQLRYSPILLLAASAIMAVLFAGPWLGVLSGHAAGRVTGLVALGAMFAGYWSIIRFYRLHPAWTLGLAAAGPMFLVMTWDSARCHWFGRGSDWKGRHYPAPVASSGRRRP